jgi:two-component system response regulator FixJ
VIAAEPTVYIVDDDDAVRDSLETFFAAEGFQVAAFGSAVAFLQVQAPQGCVVTDMRMPEMNGLELMAELSRRDSAPPVIMITGHGDVPLAVRAMKMGAADFVEKPFDPGVLLARVRDVLQTAPPAAAAAPVVEEIQRHLERLTPRERDVLEQLVIGRSNKAIGRELDISPRTVEVHRARVMEKMEASSLSELVRLALAAGIDPTPL